MAETLASKIERLSEAAHQSDGLLVPSETLLEIADRIEELERQNKIFRNGLCWKDPDELLAYGEKLEITESQLATARQALQELVALKDMKDALERRIARAVEYGDYHRRKPLAWQAARAAIRALEGQT